MMTSPGGATWTPQDSRRGQTHGPRWPTVPAHSWPSPSTGDSSGDDLARRSDLTPQTAAGANIWRSVTYGDDIRGGLHHWNSAGDDQPASGGPGVGGTGGTGGNGGDRGSGGTASVNGIGEPAEPAEPAAPGTGGTSGDGNPGNSSPGATGGVGSPGGPGGMAGSGGSAGSGGAAEPEASPSGAESSADDGGRSPNR